jgi:hypothetical protein
MLVASGVLTWGGCRSLGPRGAEDTPIDVRINRDCSLADRDQEMVALDYENQTKKYPGPYHYEIRWIVDKGADDIAVISAKPAADQDPYNYERGLKIKRLLDGDFLFSKGKKELLSGKPKRRPPYNRNAEGKDDPVAWRYAISILHADGTSCAVDPGVCYKTADGGWICR